MMHFEAICWMKAIVGENDFYMFVNEQPKGGFKWEFLDYKPEDDHNYRPIYIRLKPAEEAIEYWKQKYLEARQSGYQEGLEEGYAEAVEALKSKSNGSPDNEMDLSYASYLESRKRP